MFEDEIINISVNDLSVRIKKWIMQVYIKKESESDNRYTISIIGKRMWGGNYIIAIKFKDSYCEFIIDSQGYLRNHSNIPTLVDSDDVKKYLLYIIKVSKFNRKLIRNHMAELMYQYVYDENFKSKVIDSGYNKKVYKSIVISADEMYKYDGYTEDDIDTLAEAIMEVIVDLDLYWDINIRNKAYEGLINGLNSII